MYTVINYRTKTIIAIVPTAKKARARVDKADRHYGACTATYRTATAEEALSVI